MEETGKPQNNYWVDFYKLNTLTDKPSGFCTYVCDNYNLKDKKIVELCCGNGRDSYFLSNHCKEIHAVDRAIKLKELVNLRSHKQDIIDFFPPTQHFDLTYCRFGLHSITEEIEDVILQHSNVIFFEFRSDKDNSYKEDHFRRRINGNNFLSKLIDFQYEIVYYKEAKDLAIFENQNPYIIRVIAKKYKKENK